MGHINAIKQYFSEIGRSHWKIMDTQNGCMIYHMFNDKLFTEVKWVNNGKEDQLIACTPNGIVVKEERETRQDFCRRLAPYLEHPFE